MIEFYAPVIEKNWIYKNHECLVIFMPGGYRCGYCHVPPALDRIKPDQWMDSMPIICHGGITYASKAHPITGENQPGCWIGYDCNHCDDRIDTEAMEVYKFPEIYSRRSWSDAHAIVRTQRECEGICHFIVDQLTAIEKRERAKKKTQRGKND